MSTHELIELAVLDALGILEPHEIEQFEQAFAAAEPGVRAQVRAEQSRLTDIEDLLPDDQPRPELRDLVLAAVRAAIGTELQPVAGRIGRRAPVQPRIKIAQHVSPVWRAASIALTAVVVSLLVFNAQTKQIMTQAQAPAVVDAIYDALGPEYAALMLTDSATTRDPFTLVSNDESTTPPSALAWHNEKMNDISMLVVRNLKGSESDHFRVAILDDDGNVVKELATFKSTGQITGVEIKLDMRTLTQPLAITRISKDARGDLAADEILMIANTQANTQS